MCMLVSDKNFDQVLLELKELLDSQKVAAFHMSFPKRLDHRSFIRWVKGILYSLLMFTLFKSASKLNVSFKDLVIISYTLAIIHINLNGAF